MIRKNILLACIPKSGSTFMAKILSNLPGFEETSWVPDYGRREQELCIDRLISDFSVKKSSSLVAQHHVRYSSVTAGYIKRFDLKPLVLVRRFFDVVPSLIDHHRNTSVVYPMAFTQSDVVAWDYERAAHFVVDMVLPWYFNFYVSWHECDSKFLVTYERLQAAPVELIEDVCVRYGIPSCFSEIEVAVKMASSLQTRLNSGVVGRGDMLPDSCKEKIYKMARYYAGVDFSPVLPAGAF